MTNFREILKQDARGWIAIAWIIIGGLAFWQLGLWLSALYPTLQSTRGALLEGAALRFCMMPLGMLLFFVLFREWVQQSGLRLLIAGVQWMVLALVLSIVIKEPWEVYGTLDLVNNYVGGPYTILPAGIWWSCGLFLLLMLGALIIIPSMDATRPKWEKWLEYSPLLVLILAAVVLLLIHARPEV